jgi:transcriptional regulator with PAS, ATPase and Fis domain
MKKKDNISGRSQSEKLNVRKLGESGSAYFNSFEFLKNILDHIQIGIIISDAEGYLIYINEKYGQLLSVDPEKHIGKHVTEIIKTSRLHIVAKTGRAEINWPHELNGKTLLVQRIPLKREGKVLAVLGTVLFNDPEEVSEVANQLFKLEAKLKLFQNKLSSLLSTQYNIDSILGKSKIIQVLKETAIKAMNNDFSVLITGESGTGKELFAQAIHDGSPRRVFPFVHFNCAAIPKDLFESELFGYDPGAFTGAHPKGKMGKLELADKGSIFLDEIGDMPLDMQPKLLRVLETKQFERVGGNAILGGDFRVIAATNRNLKERMDAGLFRQDLYYRLNVLSINIPPLRERPEDIRPVVDHILFKNLKMTQFERIQIDESAMEALESYSWPGNVRELSNILERTLCNIRHDTIGIEDLPEEVKKKGNGHKNPRVSLKAQRSDAEKQALTEALVFTDNNKTKAAKNLGIHRSLLYKKLAKYNIK